MSKCFCHFNGYEVKDAKARNDIEGLANLQIPTEYVENVVSEKVAEYVEENSGGFATKEELDNVKNTLINDNDLLYESLSYPSGNNQFNINDLKSEIGRWDGTGTWIVRDGYYTSNHIPVKQNTSYWTNNPYLYITFWDVFDKFINQIVITESNYNFITPANTRYIDISGEMPRLTGLMLNEGIVRLPYEEYSSSEFSNGLIAEVIEHKNRINPANSIYNLPYVHNCKVCCNKMKDDGNVTAYYTGVDVETTPNQIISKFIFEKGNTSGVAALILNPNGLNRVKHITDRSLHLTITNTNVTLSLLGENLGSYTYASLINEELTTPLLLDGVTENRVEININGNTVTVLVNDETFTATFTDENYNLTDFTGRYVTFEHYCGGDRNLTAMPMFTYFEVTGGNKRVMDKFIRENGLLNVSPQGIPYVLMTTLFQW